MTARVGGHGGALANASACTLGVFALRHQPVLPVARSAERSDPPEARRRLLRTVHSSAGFQAAGRLLRTVHNQLRLSALARPSRRPGCLWRGRRRGSLASRRQAAGYASCTARPAVSFASRRRGFSGRAASAPRLNPRSGQAALARLGACEPLVGCQIHECDRT